MKGNGGAGAFVELLVGGGETADEIISVVWGEGAGRERDADFMPLADIAHIDFAAVGDGVGGDA